ncbi:RNA polymerase sigma factor [Sporomusa termitida]|nr:sigma-70 family RNA polymerase sigma factor [Sporomusa termitida]
MTGEELVIAAQAGDGAAFAEVCRRFAGLVYKYACQPAVAGIKEEAAAEGWLALAGAVQTYDLSTGIPFAGYARQQVRYAVWNLFKRERRRWQREVPLTGGDREDGEYSLLTTLAAPDNVELAAEEAAIAGAVKEALAALPDKQRLVIVATLLGDVRLTEIAARWGITPQAVYGLRQRGLTCLHKQLTGLSILR